MASFQILHIRYLCRVADQYWAGGILLWHVGAPYPALYCINHCIELYLRALWLNENSFENEEKMRSGLKSFQHGPVKPHDIQAMISKLSTDSKKGLKGFYLVDTDVVRFAEGHGFGYGLAQIREVEAFIRTVRGMLGLRNPNSQLGWILHAIGVRTQIDGSITRGIKTILSAQNLPKPRRLRRAQKRRISFIS